MSAMDIHEILKYLPHRYPFLLVDRVISYAPGKDIIALKNVPHHPVMPGVLIVEALAQAAAILTLRTVDEKNSDDFVYYFVGIDGVRFKKPVMAGDQLILKVAVDRQIKGVWKYSSSAEVDGKLVTEAKLMCTARNIKQ